MNTKYDKTDPLSIEAYGKKMVGKTFLDIIQESSEPYETKQKLITSYGNKKRKGGLGNLIEEVYFGYKANSDQSADFLEAGVELKASPYEYVGKGKVKDVRAGERLVVTMIDYQNPVEDDYFKSHVHEKINKMLLVYYLRNRNLPSNLDYPIDYVKLYSPTQADLKIIQDDYKKINDKIKSGKAHELSESDTIYLSACTKGSTAAKSWVPQYYNPEVKAKKRAYSLKQGFMTQVLKNYLVKDIDTYEPIIKNPAELNEQTFEDIVQNRIHQHNGKTDEALCVEFDRVYNNDKSLWADLALRMLGIKSNKAEEFVKANIVVKAVRINEKNKIVESSSLPSMPLIELVDEEWEESKLYKYFEETKFLLVVFKKVGDRYVLKGSQFWNMPESKLNTVVKDGWEQIRKVVKEGIVFTPSQQSNGIVIKNNLPKKGANGVIHLRPHTSKSYYVFEDGTTHGSGNINNSEALPDGRRMTKQSFWINNSFLYSVLEEHLKNE